MGHRDRVQPVNFFRSRILSIKSLDELRQYIGGMEKDQAMMRQAVHNLMWHMRGSLSREEAWILSPMERDDLRKFIEERMKLVEKTNLPLI